MIAPDPGLTDLIAAHWTVHEIDDDGDWITCDCGERFAAPRDWAEHLKLVVEQHAIRRTAATVAIEDLLVKAVEQLVDTRTRAKKAEATVARAWSVIPNYSGESGGKATAEQVAWLDGVQHVERQLIAALRAD